MATPTRWERLLDLKPIPILDHLVEELAKLFATDLRGWPPRLEDFDPLTGHKVQALLAEHPLRPDDAVFKQAFVLTRMDLTHELDAYDDYLRNQRWQAAGLTAKDTAMLLFLSRLLTEQLLALGEHTEGRVNRARMLEVLARTERHLFAGSPT